jgi:hypothetical protein
MMDSVLKKITSTSSDQILRGLKTSKWSGLIACNISKLNTPDNIEFFLSSSHIVMPYSQCLGTFKYKTDVN